MYSEDKALDFPGEVPNSEGLPCTNAADGRLEWASSWGRSTLPLPICFFSSSSLGFS